MSNATPGGQVGYNGNFNLIKGPQSISFTPHQVAEIRKCIIDPVYFAETYIKIINVDRGLMPFELWDFQKDMIRTYNSNRFVICKMPRQVGKTSTIVAYLLHQIIFRPQTSVAILANKGSTARDILSRLKLAYQYLPLWMQQGVVKWNMGDITLTNESRVVAASTSTDSIRGGSYNIIFLDEFAFVPNNDAEKFFTSVYPTVSSRTSTQVLIVSTPNGLNHFYKKWQDAVKQKSKYVPLEVHWSQVPGRDEKWKEETIANTSEDQFRQEFECDFIGSAHTLISPSILRTLDSDDPVFKDDDGFKVFQEPKPNHIYVLTADVSEGQQLDYSAVSVIDVTEVPYHQVARYRNNTISTMLFPTIIYNIARKYNDAHVLVETTTIGQQVADILHYELEYERLVKVYLRGRQGQQISQGFTKKVQFGLKQSKQTKRIGCTNLKTLIESRKLILHDEETILELTSFVAHKESYAAEQGSNDDLVMTMVMFAWFIAQRQFKEGLQNDIRTILQKETLNIDQEDLLPAPIIDDGMDDLVLDEQDKLEGWVVDRKRNYPFDSYTDIDYTGRTMRL